MKYVIHANEPFKGSIVTALTDHGRDIYTGEKADYLPPHFRQLDETEFDRLLEEFHASQITSPTPITEDRYHQMLEVLPPARWGSYGGWEAFHLIERLTGNLVDWFAHDRAGRYVTFVDTDKASAQHIADKLKGLDE